jgi:uncharacterized membrane protein YqaE (UPF0057 family)
MMWRPQNASEISRCPWVVEEEGVYEYTGRFEDYSSLYQPSDEARLVVVAEVVPMNILFDVQPRDFKPGTSLTLTAQVNDSRSGDPLSGYTVRFYAVDGEGSKARIGDDATNGNGVATLPWTYVLGPYAFMAEVAAGQSMISSPVMLTVAEETGLSLDVEKGESSFDHTFSGCLLSYGEPVLYRQVKILVNDTVEAVLTTNPDGSFSLTLSLQPANDKPTAYNIQAVFDGDEPCSATAYGYTPNGTEYAVCTTVQYGFKPASNATWLTVEPQATQMLRATKTPGEMQAEAESSGWLSTWHEFSWWYPWYRMHFVYLNSGVMQFDVGISLLPFGDIVEYAEGFIQKTVDLLPRVSWKIVTGLATAEFTALLASAGGPGFFLLALGLSIGTKAAAAIASWNSIDDLISVFFGVFIPTVISMVKTGIWDLFLNVLYLLTQIKSLAEVGFGKLYSMISIPLNIAYLGQIMQRLDELGAF